VAKYTQDHGDTHTHYQQKRINSESLIKPNTTASNETEYNGVLHAISIVHAHVCMCIK